MAFHQNLLIIQGVKIPYCKGKSDGNFKLDEMAIFFLSMRNKELQKHPDESHELVSLMPDKHSLAHTGTMIGY